MNAITKAKIKKEIQLIKKLIKESNAKSDEVAQVIANHCPF